MSRFDLGRAELTEAISDMPAYRSRQIWDNLYQRWQDFGDMTDLPKALRDRLANDEKFASALSLTTETEADNHETTKWLFSLADRTAIETVLMHHLRHSTVCVSSQAGCAMACSFCATGQEGFVRHLTEGEIVEQVVHAARAAQQGDRRLDHVVFMGMGEPLANLKAVLPAIDKIIDDIGLAARHVTVSTVGVVPGIKQLAAYPRQVNLAVSLHAANDTLRNSIVPLNRRYPLAMLLDACRKYIDATHRRISFEWALIADINDHPSDAEELAVIARELRAHVNLIPLNPTALGATRGLNGSPYTVVRSFRQRLEDLGVNATVRRTRGRDIDAACGQLARNHATAQESTRGTPDQQVAISAPSVRPRTARLAQ